MSEPNDAASGSDAASRPPDAERVIAGRYRLAEVIGIGGMATVHRAFDTSTGRNVAVKLLRREVMADVDIAMRFRREALAATVLRHPNIVACLETGTDDGQPFLVMELIEGEDLAGRLRRVGRLRPSETARIGLDVARGLGVAHLRGIVHRDIKPGNILLARDGRAMLTDFGIARLSADAEGAVPGTTLGSVHYFSPEQAAGQTTTAASDVYSLGLVLYEALTGQRAWSGETTAALATARIGAEPPSPRAIRPDIPAALDAIVVHALDPDPTRRFPNGNAFAAALDSVVMRPDPASPTVATDTAVLAGAAAAVAVADPPWQGGLVAPLGQGTARTSALDRRRALGRPQPVIAAPLAVLLIVAAVVVGALFLASRPGPGQLGGIAVASGSPRPTRSADATASPTTRATPTPRAATPAPVTAPPPTPRAAATPRRGANGTFDLCDPILGFACGLDKGTYEPSKFVPPIRFKLDDGWAATLYESDLIALGRPEGNLTLAGAVTTVFPSGQGQSAPRSARGLVETFVVTDKVAAAKPKELKVDKRRAFQVDLTPIGRDAVPLFATATQTYYIEPFDTTRIVVIDAEDGPFVVAIEAVEDSTLGDARKKAEPVLKSLQFR